MTEAIKTLADLRDHFAAAARDTRERQERARAPANGLSRSSLPDYLRGRRTAIEAAVCLTQNLIDDTADGFADPGVSALAARIVELEAMYSRVEYGVRDVPMSQSLFRLLAVGVFLAGVALVALVVCLILAFHSIGAF